MSTRLLMHTLRDPPEEENNIYKKRKGNWSKLTHLYEKNLENKLKEYESANQENRQNGKQLKKG